MRQNLYKVDHWPKILVTQMLMRDMFVVANLFLSVVDGIFSRILILT